MFIRFGPFELDPKAGDLRKLGQRVKLQEKPLVVLESLLERAGQIVTRAELRKRLWPDDTFVDFDNGLNNAISRVRAALGDSAETPRFIETLGRRGYRFRADAVSAGVHDEAVEPLMPRPVRGWLFGEMGRLPLMAGENVVGRAGEDVIELASSTVSRRHARITLADETFVEDLGSKNGTFVGDRPVAGRVRLADGDQLRIGSFLLTFRLAQTSGETSTRSRSTMQAARPQTAHLRRPKPRRSHGTR